MCLLGIMVWYDSQSSLDIFFKQIYGVCLRAEADFYTQLWKGSQKDWGQPESRRVRASDPMTQA